MRGRGLDAAVIPDRLPEAVQVGHRPLPQILVAVEAVPALEAELAGERRHVGALHPVRTRCPQQVTLADLNPLASSLHIADGATAGPCPAMCCPHKCGLGKCWPHHAGLDEPDV